MFSRPVVLFLLIILYQVLIICGSTKKKPVEYKHEKPAAKYDNPNFVKDRHKIAEISKPQMPITWNERNREPFHPAWMDYCDQYHCNDYHKPACGLNIENKRYQWFQSGCHILLNNKCAYFRGLLKFLQVDAKYCMKYVKHIRSSCPRDCEDEELNPVCAIDADNHPVLFINSCAIELANCDHQINQYEAVHMRVCDYHFRKLVGI